MIDVHGKPATDREAVASGRIHMSHTAIQALRDGELPKGDALAAARIAGIDRTTIYRLMEKHGLQREAMISELRA